MKRSSCLLRLISSLALLSFSVSGLFGQSIADAARKERARREQSGSDAKVLTEEDLRAISPEARRSGRQESSLATEPQDGKGGEHSVPFSLRGQSMIVSVGLNNRAHARLILDTGASMTSLSRAVAAAAGIQVTDKNVQLPMQTANGITMAPMVKLNSLRLGEVIINDLDVVLLNNWPDGEVAGLLGMNVLNRFHWQIDATRSRLVLKPGQQPSEKEAYGGYEREWWAGQFRFLRASLDHWQNRLAKAEDPGEAADIKASMEKLEMQLDTLTREANRAGVPATWRR